MMKPTTKLLAWCSLAVLALAPLAGGHLTAPSASSAALTGDAYRWTDNTPSTNSGVSGTYLAMSGAFVGGDMFPLEIKPYADLYATSVAVAYCNFEVLSSGAATDPLKLLDESKVDNGNAGGGNNGGLVPDGTWDDGGIGGACHSAGYAEADYNTLGCSGIAHAEDAGAEYHVWTAAACDDSSSVGIGLGTCIANAILAGGNGLLACTDGITCVINQTCGAGTFQACGGDGQADEVNYGYGGGDQDEVTHNSFPFSNDPDSPGLPDEPGQGVAYPADIAACDSLASAFVYITLSVEANVGIGDDPAGIEYAIPIGGWIDWTATGTTSGPYVPGDGVTVDVPACADGRDNDGDMVSDFPLDPGCSDLFDDSEHDSSLVCDDGLDNDGDGAADYPNDGGCDGPTDSSENSPGLPCDDGIDNDMDTRADYPGDPGCSSTSDPSERGSAQCDDGIDNDQDGFVDYPRDSNCFGPEPGYTEFPPPQRTQGCVHGC
jgi:hypothetical protein